MTSSARHFSPKSPRNCCCSRPMANSIRSTLQSCRAGRGRGEPIRMFVDMDQDAAIVSLFVNKGGRKFLVASDDGQGFIVNEDDCVGNTRKGKQVRNVKGPAEPKAIAVVSGNMVAAIVSNHKMVVFGIE